MAKKKTAKTPTKIKAAPRATAKRSAEVEKPARPARKVARKSARETARPAVAEPRAAAPVPPPVVRAAPVAKKPKVAARQAAARPEAATVVRPEPRKAAPPQRKLPAAELARIRAFLSQKKLAISKHMHNELVELEKPEKRHRADLEEMASDSTDSLCEIMDIEAAQLDQIEMALTKIDNGTYGICEDCSEEIPLPRLEALPFASQCINCKRRAELRGQIAASDAAAGGS